MNQPKITDEKFIAIWNSASNPTEAANQIPSTKQWACSRALILRKRGMAVKKFKCGKVGPRHVAEVHLVDVKPPLSPCPVEGETLTREEVFALDRVFRAANGEPPSEVPAFDCPLCSNPVPHEHPPLADLAEMPEPIWARDGSTATADTPVGSALDGEDDPPVSPTDDAAEAPASEDW